MTAVVPLGKRGTVTLPPEMRRKMGLDAVDNPLLIIEERDGELVLRPAAAVPIRDISKSTISGWIAEDELGMKKFEKSRRRKK